MDPRPLEQNIETWPLSRIVEYAWTHGANGGFRQFGFFPSLFKESRCFVAAC
jgi:hypothetical protein